MIDAYKNGFQESHGRSCKHREVLVQSVQQLQSGDLSKIEAMLLSQASALEMMFTNLARKAAAQTQVSMRDTFVKLALKAQNQSRAILQTLIQRYQPKQTAFIQQANIAHGYQQVNNLASCEKNTPQPSQLLVQKQTHGS